MSAAVQYKPLIGSDASDDDDDDNNDDNDIYEYNTNNHHPSKPSSNQRHKTIQFRDIAPPAAREGAAVRKWKRKRRNMIVGVVVVMLVVIGGVAATVFAYLSHEFNTGVVHDVHFTSHGDWTLFFNKTVTESSVTLIDVDGDGLDDIIMGLTKVTIAENYPPFHNMTVKDGCKKTGLEYPCLSQVVALRGYDRRVLWRTWMRFDLIFLNCDGIDVNADGKPDCIFSGRTSSLQAVDLATGKIHWVTDAEEATWGGHFVPMWLVCRALSIADVDGDGIKDLLVTHGGDPDKEPEDHERQAGRAIFLSGQTGRPLGRYLEMPDSRETYMSPVSYQTANGSTYILLGSGGETVPGDLMIVSYSDLHGFIMDNKPTALRTLYRGQEKGVMISPVLVDVTDDGTPDILMSAFEGVVALYDGETLQEIWRRRLSNPQALPDLESYSVPAPGRFDEDDVPDFMMMWGKGRWPRYDYATVYVLSGVDGNVLWQRQTGMVPYYSPLTLRTQGPRDLFLFRTAGTVTSPSSPNSQRTHHKRHIGSHGNESDDGPTQYDSLESFLQMCENQRRLYAEEQKTCSMDLTQLREEVFLLDPAHPDLPHSLHTASPQPFHYTVPVEKRGRHCHDLSPVRDDEVDICIVLEVKGITGAVGDVDGDGEADLIQAEFVEGKTIKDNYRRRHMYGDVILSRQTLSTALRGSEELVPMKDQPWRQFMGAARDGVYRVPK